MIQNNIQTITGAKSVIDTLKSLDVDTIFGYPGGIVLDLYDELYKQNSVKHILARHEQAAVHEAEGYARVSGKCGVVFVTSGPGATNTITGITNAYLDGYPLVVITGQVSSNLIGKDAFQEADICSIAKTCTKKVFQIKDANEISNIITEAFNIANSGKKGPVLIDIPKNVLSQKIVKNDEFKNYINGINKYTNNDIANLASLINKSQKPVLVAGGGVHHSKAYNVLENISSNYNIPIVSTMMGLGSISSDNNNYYGMIGIFGSACANEIIKQSDLIISLGARWNDRITCILDDCDISSKFVQIDINPNEISKNIKPIFHIIGDISSVLRELCSFNINNYKNSEWISEINIFKNLNKQPQKTTNLLHSFEVLQEIQEYTKNMDVIFTSEVGQHQVYAAQNLKFSPQRPVLFSGGLGTMGFGLPASIGASIANPSKTVICIAGDGSLQMNLGELALCKDYDLNIKIFVLNNGYLGMVRQLQQKGCNGRYSQTKISNPDFIELGKSFGIESIKVNSKNQIKSALDKVFSDTKTYLVDFEVEPIEIV